MPFWQSKRGNIRNAILAIKIVVLFLIQEPVSNVYIHLTTAGVKRETTNEMGPSLAILAIYPT